MKQQSQPAEELILVVDDTEAARFARVQLLRRAGYEVVEATHGAQALQLTAAIRPALVMLDIGLPDLSGIEVCRRVRQDPDLAHVVVLQTSATFVHDSDRARGLDGGADGYLIEPIDPAVLLATVRALLRMRHAEQRLSHTLERERDARREAETANRMKDDFVATVSHELRNPLNAIVGWSYLLREGKLDEATRAQAIDVIERNARAQAALIEDLLDVSRMVSGKLKLSMDAHDLGGIVAAAVEATRPAVEAKGIAIRAELEPGLPRSNLDRRRIEQVLDNLFSNAIKFTGPGGSIEVRLESSGGGARIVVADTGKGISPDFLPHVFDRFRQEANSTDRTKSGLGLGLAIARQIVELHQGSIEVTSEGEGKGAQFVVVLPWIEPPVDSATETIGADALSGVRVLVVDDDMDPREMYTYALRDHGAEVEAVPSAKLAYERILQHPPDVLVSDIGMPGQDGFDLVVRLRALPKHAGGGIPALAVTAFAREEDRALAFASGYDEHLSKPLDGIRLVTAVARLVRDRR